jgi:hypothetical protein
MLLPFFQWMQDLEISGVLRNSPWLGPGINVLHLLALTVFAGALLMVDLRLLGTGLTRQPLAQLARAAQPWLIGAFVALAITGSLQLISTGTKQYYSEFFWGKMEILAVALIFTFTLRRWVTQANEQRVGPVWGKVVGLVSITLWTTVTVGARLIGLLS